MILFVGGSLLAAIATSAGSLIGARAVQSVGGARVQQVPLSSVNSLLPWARRCRAPSPTR